MQLKFCKNNFIKKYIKIYFNLYTDYNYIDKF